MANADVGDACDDNHLGAGEKRNQSTIENQCGALWLPLLGRMRD